MCFLVLCDMTLYTTLWTLNLLVLPMHLEMKIEWNLNLTKFNLNFRIELKFNQTQMGCKLLENVFKIFLWIWCWKFLKKKKI
jgi:hypothetical protein